MFRTRKSFLPGYNNCVPFPANVTNSSNSKRIVHEHAVSKKTKSISLRNLQARSWRENPHRKGGGRCVPIRYRKSGVFLAGVQLRGGRAGGVASTAEDQGDENRLCFGAQRSERNAGRGGEES